MKKNKIMNNKEFLQQLSKDTNTSLENTKKLVNSIIDEMGIAFEEGENVLFNDFGTFEIKKRMERIVVNPSTHQRMLVPPKLVLNFKPVSSLRDKFKKKGGN